jgi:hypothetical protein
MRRVWALWTKDRADLVHIPHSRRVSVRAERGTTSIRPSIQTELVAFDVLHHDAGLFAVAGRQ